MSRSPEIQESSSKHSQHADIVETRSILDKQMSQAEDPTEILQLKHIQNALSPASSIPPEVLCDIFTFVKAANTGKLHPDEMFGPRALEWVRVTHVCRWWRDVALDASWLWTDITLASRRWAEKMFVRSKEAPLIIYAHFGVLICSGPIYIPQHVARIRELNILGNGGNVLHMYRFLSRTTTITTTPPPIHTLRISYNGELEDNLPFLISDSMFKANGLRRLSLKGCKVDWDASFFPGLTHLRLHNIPFDSLFGPSEFLAILQRLPLLESLDARGPYPPSQDTPSRRSDCQRRKCSIGVVASPEVVIKLEGYAHNPSPADYVPALSTIFARYRPPLLATQPHQPIQSLELSRVGTSEFIIRAYPTVLSQDEMATLRIPGPPLMESVFTWDQIDLVSEWKITKPLFHALPLEHLVVLHVTGQLVLDTDTCAQTFGTLPALRSIHIEHSVTSFFDALVYGISDSQSGSFPLVPFQALESISISYSWEDVLEDPFSLVIQRLIERYELGAEIHQLFLKDCSWLSRRDLGLLREVVVDVAWDVELPVSPYIRSLFRTLFSANEIDELDILAGYWY
ncbi:hypothetical protein BDZ97DRAFT_2071437 [Flammula alnicola]|nr:hypothetical protein BDZ97DRAFT_2071437 [Flammula alnicola]